MPIRPLRLTDVRGKIEPLPLKFKKVQSVFEKVFKMRREFLLFLLFSSATCQPCGDNVSVDLSDMDTFRDGSIMKNGVHYPPKFIYSKNVTGVIKTFGCICELKPCFRKCCPMGSVMLGRECAAMPEYDNITNHGLAVHYINNLIETVDIRSKSNPFAMFYGRPCPKVYLSDDGREFVQKVSLIIFIYLRTL